MLKASEAGNNDELLKCLNKDNQKDFMNNQADKRRMIGVSQPTPVLENKKRKINDLTGLPNEDDKKQDDEEEDIVFECVGCSG